MAFFYVHYVLIYQTVTSLTYVFVPLDFRPRFHPVAPQPPCSSQNSGQAAKNFVHDSIRNPFESFSAQGFHINCPGLIATHNTCGTYSNTIQRHRKAGSAGKIASAGYGHNNRQVGHAIKGRRCDNQHRPRSLLLITGSAWKTENIPR